MRENQIIIQLLKRIQADVKQLKRRRVVKKCVIRPNASNCDAKFPIDSEQDLNQFEKDLQTENTFNSYVAHFNSQLKNVRSAVTIYNRRKSLKELMFTEYVYFC